MGRPQTPYKLREVPLRLAANLSQAGLAAGILAKNTALSEASEPCPYTRHKNVPFNLHARGQQ